ncbi:hypothetical protein TIFTF001_014874 [Ficus carica]|uniref:Uncharacterized protein n=1 Tax=Ficus carica TaxID=3494 RepID=A0AA88A4R3_FICCA|nr:hypothetical protein TIFTF001_014874 [Ficus carica]
MLPASGEGGRDWVDAEARGSRQGPPPALGKESFDDI